MTELFYITGISLLIVSFLSVTALPKILDRKPFNCTTCLSFWTSIATMISLIFYPQTELLIKVIAIAGYAAYIGTIGRRIMFRI